MNHTQIKYFFLFLTTVLFIAICKLYCPQLMFIPQVLFGVYVSKKVATLENIQKIIDWYRK